MGSEKIASRYSLQNLRIGPVSPQHPTLRWSETQTQVMVSLTNQGDQPLHFCVTANNARQEAWFEFALGADKVGLSPTATITLLPDETRQLTVLISPRQYPLLGFSRDHTFTLTIHSLQGAPSTKSVLGHFRCQPLIGSASGMMITIGLAILLVALFSFGPFGRPAAFGLADSRSSPDLFGDVFLSWRIETPPTATSPAVSAPAVMAPPVGESLPASAQTYETYEAMFKAVAREYSLDWRLLAAQAYYESQMDPGALGQDQDMGLMQIIPATWAIFSAQVAIERPDPFDPYHNLVVAARYHTYLAETLRAKPGCSSERWILAAYNWGPDNVLALNDCQADWTQVPPQTRQYVDKILQKVGQPTLALPRLQEPVRR